MGFYSSAYVQIQGPSFSECNGYLIINFWHLEKYFYNFWHLGTLVVLILDFDVDNIMAHLVEKLERTNLALAFIITVFK